MTILSCSVLAKASPSRAQCVFFVVFFFCRPHTWAPSKRETKSAALTLSRLVNMCHKRNKTLKELSSITGEKGLNTAKCIDSTSHRAVSLKKTYAASAEDAREDTRGFLVFFCFLSPARYFLTFKTRIFCCLSPARCKTNEQQSSAKSVKNTVFR